MIEKSCPLHKKLDNALVFAAKEHIFLCFHCRLLVECE